MNKVVIVTGVSGAGKTTALKILEDIGYEAVDNLPCLLLKKIVNKELHNNLAICVDIRSRKFDTSIIKTIIKKNKNEINLLMIFFDCETITLINRFKVTRRRHPIKMNIPINDIIEQERNLLSPLKKFADITLDTTNLEVPALQKTMESLFKLTKDSKINLRLMSFGFKFGIPREADIVMDVRFLENPFYINELKKLTGRSKKVINFLEKQKIFPQFLKSYLNTLHKIIPYYRAEGKKYLTVAFGCTGGIHRSVFVTEKVFKEINKNNIHVFLDHRDIKR